MLNGLNTLMLWGVTSDWFVTFRHYVSWLQCLTCFLSANQKEVNPENPLMKVWFRSCACAEPFALCFEHNPGENKLKYSHNAPLETGIWSRSFVMVSVALEKYVSGKETGMFDFIRRWADRSAHNISESVFKAYKAVGTFRSYPDQSARHRIKWTYTLVWRRRECTDSSQARQSHKYQPIK